jgi:multidrug transporter EmrE-like cation transporter
MNLHKVLLITTAAILALIPVFSMQYAIIKPRDRVLLFAIAIVASIGLVYTYYHLFRLGSIGPLYGIAKGLSIVLVVIGGIFLFSQNLQPATYLGLGLIVAGVIVVGIKVDP